MNRAFPRPAGLFRSVILCLLLVFAVAGLGFLSSCGFGGVVGAGGGAAGGSDDGVATVSVPASVMALSTDADPLASEPFLTSLGHADAIEADALGGFGAGLGSGGAATVSFPESERQWWLDACMEGYAAAMGSYVDDLGISLAVAGVGCEPIGSLEGVALTHPDIEGTRALAQAYAHRAAYYGCLYQLFAGVPGDQVRFLATLAPAAGVADDSGDDAADAAEAEPIILVKIGRWA